LSDQSPSVGTNFIHGIIDKDLKNGLNGGRVHTRFPPEPNGYLHIGHAKSICLNFGIKKKYGGQCNLRFDDTNPMTEDPEFIKAIQEDVRWLGFEWDNLCYSSSYFQQLYDWAVELIKKDKAYVCSLNEEETRKYRGSHTEPGKNSPFRSRSVAENLELFQQMKEGKFKDGEHVLRAKIDMASGNMNMRDPLIYRIRHAHHPITGDDWCIYPLYDFTHGLSDAIENITHSICTLEFADHRPLYDWFLEQLDISEPPRQYEFSKLFLSHFVFSKRNMKKMIEQGVVDGWDDPRMPTIRGFRRRGYTAKSIRNFCENLGVSRAHSIIPFSQLEESLRQDLNEVAPRRMVVIRPLKVTLTNYDEIIQLSASNHPKNEAMGTRTIQFSKNIFIEKTDFLEEAPKKFFRLKPGGEVRLRNSYIIRCDEVIKDNSGEVVELKCSIDPDTLGKNPEGRKVKGIVHWVDSESAVPIEVRLYDRLFTEENPSGDKEKSFLDFLNPNSLEILDQALGEKPIRSAEMGQCYQFERLGYFTMDKTSSTDKLIFNRSVTLRDNWK